MITNITANNVIKAQQSLETSVGKLSSGSRIAENRNDLAGMSFSSALDKDALSLSQAMKNINDGLSLLQVLNGVYTQQYDILVRARVMAVQNMNETYSDEQRALNSEELAEYLTSNTGEYDRLARAADFNGIGGSGEANFSNLMTTLSGSITFQIGIDNLSDNKFTLQKSDISSTIKSVSGLRLVSIDTQADAQSAVSVFDDGLDLLSQRMATVGSFINRLEHAMGNNAMDLESLNLTSARIQDLDYAAETSKMTRDQIKFNASTAALGQAKSMKISNIDLIS